MGVRSVNNTLQSFSDTFVRSGTDASDASAVPVFSATGGTILTPGNGYRYHTFTSTGTFTISSGSAKNMDILLVAGGGGGGSYYGSGGGAGGIAYATAIPIGPGPYLVSIGGGGGSYYGSGALGLSGGSGGGTGGSPPGNGGSATQPAQNPGNPFVTNYGNNGGFSAPSGGYAPAGGGGAGSAGASIPISGLTGGGNGGAGQPFPGFEYPIVGLTPIAPVANSPTNNHYGGGGGSGLYSTGVSPDRLGLGGAGGGGSGKGSSRGLTAGVENTGGAGGGAHPASAGVAGGSGVAIIRYLM